MAVLTYDEQESFGRLLALDTDTTSGGGLTTDEWQLLINDWYLRYKAEYDHSVSTDTVNYAYGSYTSTVTLTSAYRSIVSVKLSGTGSVLQRRDAAELYQQIYNNHELGTPVYYGFFSTAGVGTGRKYFTLMLHPTPSQALYPSGANIDIYYESYPVTVGPGDTMDVGDGPSRWIARMAAADAARILGRDPSVVAQILAPIPGDVKAKMGFEVSLTGPRMRRSEEQL